MRLRQIHFKRIYPAVYLNITAGKRQETNKAIEALIFINNCLPVKKESVLCSPELSNTSYSLSFCALMLNSID